MKRLIAALLLVTAVSALPLTGAGAAMGDSVKGPACGDITGDAFYTDDFTGVATVFASFDTVKPSCDRATYTLSVYATGASPALLGQTQVAGDGATSHFDLSAVASGAPTKVCVTLSSTIGGRTVDQAPDSADGECSIGTQRNLDGGTGASGMR